MKAAGLPALSLGDEHPLRVADIVHANGNPLGVGQTVTACAISAEGRQAGHPDGRSEDFLQTDAAINCGNSGGRAGAAFGEFTGYFTPDSLDDLETETLPAPATSEERSYATLPEAVRELINTRYLLPPVGRHQMFGRGAGIQGSAACENGGT